MNLTPADYRALIDRARVEERLTLVEWEALDSLLVNAAVRDQQLEDARALLADIYRQARARRMCPLCRTIDVHADDCAVSHARAFLAGLDVQEAGQ